jgi:hypothetical protein
MQISASEYNGISLRGVKELHERDLSLFRSSGWSADEFVSLMEAAGTLADKPDDDVTKQPLIIEFLRRVCVFYIPLDRNCQSHRLSFEFGNVIFV